MSLVSVFAAVEFCQQVIGLHIRLFGVMPARVNGRANELISTLNAANRLDLIGKDPM